MGGVDTDVPEYRGSGVVATTDPITLNGKKVRLTVSALHEAAKQAPGLPMLHDHRGRPIGRITRAWVDGEKLLAEFVVFSPRNEETRKIVDKIRSGELRGLSLGFTYSDYEDVVEGSD